MKNITRRTVITGAAAVAATVAMPAIRAQARPVIKIGLGPQQPTQADTKRVWEPLYKIVCDRAGADLDLTVATDWAGISVALANEQIDVAQMGPWGYILAKVNAGSRIINTMLVDGKPTYRAIIIARPGLKVERFPEDAKGLSIQLMDRGATSGWLIPTHFFKEKGIDPQTHFGKYAEGGNASAMQLAVANGQLDLAAGWDTHRNTMIRNNLLKPDSNQIVWQSEPIPNECVVVRKGLPEDVAAKLQAALAGLGEEERKLMPPPYNGFIPATHEPYAKLEQMGRDLGVLKSS
jgi:phosphonate transport system substrate-binding protein